MSNARQPARAKWMLTSEDVRHYIDERYRRLPYQTGPPTHSTPGRQARGRRCRPVPAFGPAGADRTASAAALVVASGNYWTPGPRSGRTVALIGTRLGWRRARQAPQPPPRPRPGVTTRLGIEHRRRRLIVNSNTFSFSGRPGVG